MNYMKKRITAKDLNIRVYKSHKLSNNQIKVTYAVILGPSVVSTAYTRIFEDKGGAVTSIAYDRGLL